MRFTNDRQRRAMFAKMADKKAVLQEEEPIEIKSSKYEDIAVTSGELTKSEVPIADVPDWVTSPQKSPEPAQTVAPSGADFLVEYAKTIKPSNAGIQIQGDKSDVIGQVDDMLAQYGRNLPKEKKLVGAVKVDDEYKEGPSRLPLHLR